MHSRIQLTFAWFIPAFIVTYLTGFVALSGFLPPPLPTLLPEQIAAIFQAHRNAIRGGQLLCLVVAGLFYIPFQCCPDVEPHKRHNLLKRMV